jgi:hypothetical protein
LGQRKWFTGTAEVKEECLVLLNYFTQYYKENYNYFIGYLGRYSETDEICQKITRKDESVLQGV